MRLLLLLQLLLSVALCAVVGRPSARAGTAAGATPEEMLRTFYAWYVPALEGGVDVMETRRPELRRYVSARMLRVIDGKRRVEGGLEADPFLEAQDYDIQWGKNIAVRNVQVPGETATAEVTLTSKVMEACRLRVTLTREDNAWKLDRVEARKG